MHRARGQMRDRIADAHAFHGRLGVRHAHGVRNVEEQAVCDSVRLLFPLHTDGALGGSAASRLLVAEEPARWAIAERGRSHEIGTSFGKELRLDMRQDPEELSAEAEEQARGSCTGKPNPLANVPGIFNPLPAQ